MSEFDQLPQSLQKQIDSAFDQAHKLLSDPVSSGLVPPAAKRRKIEDSNDGEQATYNDEPSLNEEEGGFLLDDDDNDSQSNQEEVISLQREKDQAPHPDSLALSLIPPAVSLWSIYCPFAEFSSSVLPLLSHTARLSRLTPG